jgi:hypothetical protein
VEAEAGAADAAPAREPFDEQQREERSRPAEPVHAEIPAFAEPIPPAAAAPAPESRPHVEFHAVSEHDQEQEEAQPQHRPHRRRRGAETAATAPAEPALELVETQVEAAPAVAEEEELPRRTRPRRRRSTVVENEPLQLVETRPGTPGESSPTP